MENEAVTPQKALMHWLKEDLGQRGYQPREESLAELVEAAEHIVRLHLLRPNKLRPSKKARQFIKMAKGLRSAATAAETLGTHGLLLMGAAAGHDEAFDEPNAACHILYLHQMSDLAEAAARLAYDQAKHDHGGPTSDQRLRSIVAQLILRYEHHLILRPTYTANPDKGLDKRGFTGFAKQTLEAFAPEGLKFNPHLVDSVVRELLPIRDLEFFEPPPLRRRDPKHRG